MEAFTCRHPGQYMRYKQSRLPDSQRIVIWNCISRDDIVLKRILELVIRATVSQTVSRRCSFFPPEATIYHFQRTHCRRLVWKCSSLRRLKMEKKQTSLQEPGLMFYNIVYLTEWLAYLILMEKSYKYMM